MHERILNKLWPRRASARRLLLGGSVAALAAGAAVALAANGAAPATTTATTKPGTTLSQPSQKKPNAAPSMGTLMMPPTPMAERLVASRPMASDFNTLKHRSIFIHGQQTHDTDEARSNVASVNVARPESVLIFNGVARVNDQLAAFFEDTASHEVVVRRQGDALAQGHITHITLEGIDYDANGHVTHVGLGQSLDGSGGNSLANQPTGSLNGSAGTSSGGGGDSVLDRLRRRRQQQMGH